MLDYFSIQLQLNEQANEKSLLPIKLTNLLMNSMVRLKIHPSALFNPILFTTAFFFFLHFLFVFLLLFRPLISGSSRPSVPTTLLTLQIQLLQIIHLAQDMSYHQTNHSMMLDNQNDSNNPCFLFA